jgi:hypothetical protein
MNSLLRATALLGLLAAPWSDSRAQIRVHPTGVNVAAQGATTVLLTFGGLTGYRAAEAFWCGDLIPAAPAIGFRCNPATLFGQLPIRFDQSTPSGTSGFTDIMTIPASVTRRAYQAAEAGQASSFFYVRRFVSQLGGPDQFVAVTCRMAGGGARSPLSLVDVRLAFTPEVAVLHLGQGEIPPTVSATVAYTGTGRLAGRWEVVLPGEEPPSVRDLLTAASLPLEERASQRRYTQVGRFNIFLPPTGSVVVPGPDPALLPTAVDGVYFLLFRVDASSEKEGDTDLGAAGAGAGVVAGGAVAGFPMPVLRYLVGSGVNLAADSAGVGGGRRLVLLQPSPGGPVSGAFTWEPVTGAALYRIEVAAVRGPVVVTAVVPEAVAAYQLPPWASAKLPDGHGRWRVTALDHGGRPLVRSEWRQFGAAVVPPAD